MSLFTGLIRGIFFSRNTASDIVEYVIEGISLCHRALSAIKNWFFTFALASSFLLVVLHDHLCVRCTCTPDLTAGEISFDISVVYLDIISLTQES